MPLLEAIRSGHCGWGQGLDVRTGQFYFRTCGQRLAIWLEELVDLYPKVLLTPRQGFTDEQ